MPAVEKGLIFNTGPYGDPPLKIKILKSGFLHAREDQKIGPEPKYHVPSSEKEVNFQHWTIWGPP